MSESGGLDHSVPVTSVRETTIEFRRDDGFRPLAHLPAAVFGLVTIVGYLVLAEVDRPWSHQLGPTPLAVTTGFVVGVMLLAPSRSWPAALIGLAIASAAHDLWQFDATVAELTILAAARVLGAITAVLVFTRVFNTPSIEFELRTVIAIVAPISALIVPATLVAWTIEVDGTSRSEVWATWVIGEGMGLIVFAPLFTLPIAPFPTETIRHLRSHLPEAIGVAALTIAVTVIGYESTTPFILLAIPILAWLAYRSSIWVAVPTAASVIAYGTFVTDRGDGPFARFDYPLLWLQLIHLVMMYFVISRGRAFWNDRWGAARYQAIMGLQPDTISIHEPDGQLIETLAVADNGDDSDAAGLTGRWDSLMAADLPARHVIADRGRDLEIRLVPLSGLVMAVTRDVTEQRQLVRELERANTHWRRLASTAFEGFIEVGPDLCVTYVSDRWATMHGRPPADIVGREFRSLFREEDLPQFRSFARQVERGAHVTFEYAHTRPDGERRWALASADGSLDDDGDFAGFVSFAADTTELHQAITGRELAELRLASVERSERERIASFLHDGPLQTLVAMAYRLNTITAGADPQATAAELERMALAAITGMREGLTDLAPSEIVNGDIGNALVTSAARFAQPGRAQVTVDDQLRGRVDIDSASTLFLIGQEAIINAILHANAESIHATISMAGEGYRLDVTDDGVGLGEHVTGGEGHLGMRSMLRRAQEAGGRCDIHPNQPRGTHVSAWIPDLTTVKRPPAATTLLADEDWPS